jgi:hypothetical protein
LPKKNGRKMNSQKKEGRTQIIKVEEEKRCPKCGNSFRRKQFMCPFDGTTLEYTPKGYLNQRPLKIYSLKNYQRKKEVNKEGSRDRLKNFF